MQKRVRRTVPSRSLISLPFLYQYDKIQVFCRLDKGRVSFTSVGYGLATNSQLEQN